MVVILYVALPMWPSGTCLEGVVWFGSDGHTMGTWINHWHS